MTSSLNLTISESNHWTDANTRLNCWLISTPREQIWLISTDFSHRRHISAFWLRFVIHNINNWWKTRANIDLWDGSNSSIFLCRFIFVLPTMLWEKCNQSKCTGWSKNTFLLNFPRNMLPNANDPPVWFTVRLSHESFPARYVYCRLWVLPQI